jgi:hypothetical protein
MEKNASNAEERTNNGIDNEPKACSIVDPECEACQ